MQLIRAPVSFNILKKKKKRNAKKEGDGALLCCGLVLGEKELVDAER